MPVFSPKRLQYCLVAVHESNLPLSNMLSTTKYINNNSCFYHKGSGGGNTCILLTVEMEGIHEHSHANYLFLIAFRLANLKTGLFSAT